MIVPSADMVTTDKLPLAAPFVEEGPWMERMAQAFGGDALFLDPTGTLREHADEYLFYRTDHHWTTSGAYYAYLQYAGAVGKAGAAAARACPHPGGGLFRHPVQQDQALQRAGRPARPITRSWMAG